MKSWMVEWTSSLLVNCRFFWLMMEWCCWELIILNMLLMEIRRYRSIGLTLSSLWFSFWRNIPMINGSSKSIRMLMLFFPVLIKKRICRIKMGKGKEIKLPKSPWGSSRKFREGGPFFNRKWLVKRRKRIRVCLLQRRKAWTKVWSQLEGFCREALKT